ncbi:2-keto-3-deoxy-D-arabino-heptulosonate-7- phosphate synthase I beta [Dehalococcoides mccartyi]|uniref:2-keto-3-deoxy-D-arabino-heptulosonate-7-phosphate synthase I beta n=1 Tax=Dehalococcoides mccartyi TaxID=61435 RepID=A0A328EKC9_9CHLR|nr:2-keto-3-deoxy-D-arabino-heptulosonate-7- phosphate synthase I beta [Dehalococcoides mccartyi]
MLVIMKNDATQEQIDNVIREITDAATGAYPYRVTTEPPSA